MVRRVSKPAIVLAVLAVVMAGCGPKPGEGAASPAPAATSAAAPAAAPSAGAEPSKPSTGFEPSRDDLIAAGGDIAQDQCAVCHAIGTATRSPRPDAPPFNTVLARYDEKNLARGLIEGVKIGHETMPNFQFNPKAADALLAYLESIQVKPKPAKQ